VTLRHQDVSGVPRLASLAPGTARNKICSSAIETNNLLPARGVLAVVIREDFARHCPKQAAKKNFYLLTARVHRYRMIPSNPTQSTALVWSTIDPFVGEY
jgi:hypothetical protein